MDDVKLITHPEQLYGRTIFNMHCGLIQLCLFIFWRPSSIFTICGVKPSWHTIVHVCVKCHANLFTYSVKFHSVLGQVIPGPSHHLYYCLFTLLIAQRWADNEVIWHCTEVRLPQSIKSYCMTPLNILSRYKFTGLAVGQSILRQQSTPYWQTNLIQGECPKGFSSVPVTLFTTYLRTCNGLGTELYMQYHC